MSDSTPLLSGLLDDAAALPPRPLPLAEVVARHREHTDLVGRLVLTDAHLSEVAPLLADGSPLDVLLVVTGGAGALEPAATWAGRTPRLRLRALTLRLRDEADLAHNAGRAVAMVDHLRSAGTIDDEVAVHVEPPRLAHSSEHGWLAALDELAAAELALRLRTGGADPDDQPAPDELARCVDAALDREMPISVTGARSATSRPDGYGALNLLAATRAALDGADVPAALVAADPLAGADLEALARTRRWCTAVTVPDVATVRDELVGLGLTG